MAAEFHDDPLCETCLIVRYLPFQHHAARLSLPVPCPCRCLVLEMMNEVLRVSG